MEREPFDMIVRFFSPLISFRNDSLPRALQVTPKITDDRYGGQGMAPLVSKILSDA